MFRLFPRDENFFAMIEQAAQNACRTAEELVALLSETNPSTERASHVHDFEHAGDHITHEIIKKLDKTFITPIDREDIYALASRIDDIVDFVDAAAGRMVAFKLPTPTPEARQFAQIILKSAEEIEANVTALRRHHNDEIFRRCVEINRLENEADLVHRDAIAKLFETEQDPITVIKWKEVYEFLEEATDRCEDVANILESVVLKHT